MYKTAIVGAALTLGAALAAFPLAAHAQITINSPTPASGTTFDLNPGQTLSLGGFVVNDTGDIFEDGFLEAVFAATNSKYFADTNSLVTNVLADGESQKGNPLVDLTVSASAPIGGSYAFYLDDSGSNSNGDDSDITSSIYFIHVNAATPVPAPAPESSSMTSLGLLLAAGAIAGAARKRAARS